MQHLKKYAWIKENNKIWNECIESLGIVVNEMKRVEWIHGDEIVLGSAGECGWDGEDEIEIRIKMNLHEKVELTLSYE